MEWRYLSYLTYLQTKWQPKDQVSILFILDYDSCIVTISVSFSYCVLLLSIDYQPVERRDHSTVRVGDYLYMWGGWQPDLPRVHNNEKKKSMCSVIEVCHLGTGIWEQKPTTGNPPLGVMGYAAAAIGREIFYFGGHCNHPGCYHNSLYR